MYKEITKVASSQGKDVMDVFKDLLDYMTIYMSINGSKEKWHKEESYNQQLFHLMLSVIREYSDGTSVEKWTDPWGQCYEELVSKSKASSYGQFFTPVGLCNLMADITVDTERLKTREKTDLGAFGMRTIISDPACGSGRNLLAASSKFIGAPKKDLPYFAGEDLDEYCVKMTALNLMAHGLPGEVICHNTLTEPDTCKFGYIVNEGLFPFPGIPTLRKVKSPDRFFSLRRMSDPVSSGTAH